MREQVQLAHQNSTAATLGGVLRASVSIITGGCYEPSHSRFSLSNASVQSIMGARLSHASVARKVELQHCQPPTERHAQLITYYGVSPGLDLPHGT